MPLQFELTHTHSNVGVMKGYVLARAPKKIPTCCVQTQRTVTGTRTDCDPFIANHDTPSCNISSSSKYSPCLAGALIVNESSVSPPGCRSVKSALLPSSCLSVVPFELNQ